MDTEPLNNNVNKCICEKEKKHNAMNSKSLKKFYKKNSVKAKLGITMEKRRSWPKTRASQECGVCPNRLRFLVVYAILAAWAVGRRSFHVIELCLPFL